MIVLGIKKFKLMGQGRQGTIYSAILTADEKEVAKVIDYADGSAPKIDVMNPPLFDIVKKGIEALPPLEYMGMELDMDIPLVVEGLINGDKYEITD